MLRGAAFQSDRADLTMRGPLVIGDGAAERFLRAVALREQIEDFVSDAVRVLACVATAPTPARTQGTPLPTHGLRVVTATPDSPVSGSIAAIEKV